MRFGNWSVRRFWLQAVGIALVAMPGRLYAETWVDDIRPALVGCAGCHSTDTNKGDSVFAPGDWSQYYSVRAKVVQIILRINGEGGSIMPPGGMPDAVLTAKLAAWMSQGMPYNATGGAAPELTYNTQAWATSGMANPGIKYIFSAQCNGACHRATVGAERPTALTFPDWIVFNQCSKLKMNSYYLPGHTKAEASIARAVDGTMPPGSPLNVGLSQRQREAIQCFFDLPGKPASCLPPPPASACP